MKRSPKDQNLALLLGPSKFSAEGFLGNDRREPEQIMADDIRVLESLGVAKETLVVQLKDVYKKAEKALGDPVRIDSLEAKYIESRGKIPSPFRSEGMFPKGEVQITDTQTDKTFRITALSIHLIDKHNFFQGRGSRYRIEPDEIVRTLNLVSDSRFRDSGSLGK